MRLAGMIFVVVGGAVIVAACGGDDSNVTSAANSGGSTGGNAQTGGTAETGGNGTGAAEPECPHTGPDVLDPSTLPECPMCAGARCVPSSLVPPEYQAQLADCDANTKCVPDDFIKTGGNFIPPTCSSIAGGEGRCVSQCLPDVAAQADLLPMSTCPEFQVCAPCYDPITSEPTGVCSLSCDPGPTQPPVQLPSCCDGVGTCVPSALVPPDQAASLPPDTCPVDANDFLCAPTVFITDPTYVPPFCETDIILLGGEPGACLPDCLVTGFQGFLLGQSTCQDGEKCAPCVDPLSGDPTGACG